MVFMTTGVIQPLQPAGSACFELFNSPAKRMALDTIKPTKNHKFPFTSPIITAHKDSPTKTLILEIIFSSDDVNSSNTIPNDGENVGNEEDENSGESDDEDDEEENYDSANNSANNDDNSDDGDKAHEEEGDEEDTSEDEDDDNGLEFDDDFGNEFDKDDLIIDFGGENEEDQLVVEFEDNSINSPSPPSSPLLQKTPVPPFNAVPFWFTQEEPDQIRLIFESYSVTLDIEKQRKACIRSPAPFIGRIKRTPIKPAESDSDKRFKTLDKVEVYLREMYPLGTMLPLSRVAWVLTTWDDDGVPVLSCELPKSTKKSVQKRANGTQSSILYCAPIFRTKEEYQYTVSPQEHSLMYASNSSTNTSISLISPFLPEHCRTISFSLD